MTKGLIYKVTSPNGKVYIGKTSKTLQERIRAHRNDYLREKYNFKFYNSLKKYGFDNFVWEVIEDSIDLNLLNEVEIKYIKQFNSFEDGLNSTIGGNGGDIFNSLSEEKKQHIVEQISLANKGKELSEETKNKISKNHKKPLLGIKQSPEWVSKRIDKATETKNNNKELTEFYRNRMLGDNNIAKRPDVRKKISEKKKGMKYKTKKILL